MNHDQLDAIDAAFDAAIASAQSSDEQRAKPCTASLTLDQRQAWAKAIAADLLQASSATKH